MKINQTVEVERLESGIKWFGTIMEIGSYTNTFAVSVENPSRWGVIQFNGDSRLSLCGQYQVTRFIR